MEGRKAPQAFPGAERSSQYVVTWWLTLPSARARRVDNRFREGATGPRPWYYRLCGRCLNAAGTRAISSIHNQRTFHAAADRHHGNRLSSSIKSSCPPHDGDSPIDSSEPSSLFSLSFFFFFRARKRDDSWPSLLPVKRVSPPTIFRAKGGTKRIEGVLYFRFPSSFFLLFFFYFEKGEYSFHSNANSFLYLEWWEER